MIISAEAGKTMETWGIFCLFDPNSSSGFYSKTINTTLYELLDLLLYKELKTLNFCQKYWGSSSGTASIWIHAGWAFWGQKVSLCFLHVANRLRGFWKYANATNEGF